MRFRTSSHDDHDTGRVPRKSTAVPAPHDRRCQRSALVPAPAQPDAKPAAAPPSPRLRNPDPGWIGALRAFRFPGRWRFGSPSGALFFGLPRRGRRRKLHLGVGPLLAGLPIGVDTFAKFAPGRNLLLGHSGLLGGQKPRTRLACYGLSQAVVRTVASLGIPSAGAARLAALDRAFGNRTAAHRLRVSQLGDE
jgi:hypothetical protein